MPGKVDTFSKLRAVLALRAIERADSIGEYLAVEDRRAWSRDAGFDGLPEQPSAARRLNKLFERTGIANSARMPWTVRPILLGLSRCDLHGVVVTIICLGALAAGVSSLQFDGQRMVNLLGLPLVLLLAWNLLVYLWIIVGVVKAMATSRRNSLAARTIATFAGSRAVKGRLRREKGDTSARWPEIVDFANRAIDQWKRPFLSLAGPVLRRRLSSILHIAAVLWALGAIAGLYYQGWSTSYGAYWESTLLDAAAAREFFAAIFLPASKLFSLPIPLEEISALQWTPGAGGQPEVSALPWFNLYAATLGLFVVGPRLVLFVLCRIGALSALGSAVRSPLMRAYFDSVRGVVAEDPAKPAWRIAVIGETPNAPEPVRKALEEWGAAHESFSEIEFVALHSGLGAEDRRTALGKCNGFLVSAELTPDDSIRRDLAVLREAAERLDVVRVVFIDAGWFLQRFADLPSLTTRWKERQAVWREAVGVHPVRPVFLRLKKTADADLAV